MQRPKFIFADVGCFMSVGVMARDPSIMCYQFTFYFNLTRTELSETFTYIIWVKRRNKTQPLSDNSPFFLGDLNNVILSLLTPLSE